jgi:fatty-acid peroxygenase
MRVFHGDQTLRLLSEGYAFLPDRRRSAAGRDFRMRLLGRPAAGVRGPEATQRFYDERLFARRPAVPEPVRSTLTGKGAVHTLDGPAHRRRKHVFMPLTEPQHVRGVVERTEREWESAVRRWSSAPHVVLFDEAAEVLAAGVFDWAGVPLGGITAREAGGAMVAMVDGFGSPGARHLRARLARRRTESRLRDAVRRVRAGEAAPPEGSVFARMLEHRDEDGRRLPDETVVVEALNVLRPTVAITWFLAYAAHALHRWPDQRVRLLEGGVEAAEEFAHEVRRFYPFAPFMGAVARRDVDWDDDTLAPGTLVLLDMFGQNHDEALWGDPWTFRPERFRQRPPGAFDLVPQGGGDPASGHRCPGEDIVVAMLMSLVPRLAALDYRVPEQDLRIPLSRIPSKPLSGVVLSDVRG